jgi:hypothetical protein
MTGFTYANYSWVLRHLGLLLGGLLDAQVLDVATSKHDLLVDCVRGPVLVLAAAAALSAE